MVDRIARGVRYASLAIPAGTFSQPIPQPGGSYVILIHNLTIRVIGAGNMVLIGMDNLGATSTTTLIGAASPGIVYQWNGNDAVAGMKLRPNEALSFAPDPGVSVVGHIAYSITRDPTL